MIFRLMYIQDILTPLIHLEDCTMFSYNQQKEQIIQIHLPFGWMGDLGAHLF